MKRLFLMIISALICGVMLTNCKRAEQKENLALASDEIVASTLENVDYEVFVKWVRDSIQKKTSNVTNSEVISLENVDYEAFVKWVRDSIQKRASNVTNSEVVSRENVDYEAFVKWVCDSIQKRSL